METRKPFIMTLDKIDELLKKQRELSAIIRTKYNNGNVGEALTLALKFEEASEKMVLLTRVLPACTGCPNINLAVESVVEKSIPVEIGFTTENWFSVRIPALLPKKTEGSADYIRSYLYPAMRTFFTNKSPIRYKNCVLIYRHVYDITRPEREKRDHDNIEVNMVSDIIAMYVMPDDGPSICSHYYCSSSGTQDRTEVYVVPKDEFAMWLITEKAMPDKGVKLYETML